MELILCACTIKKISAVPNRGQRIKLLTDTWMDHIKEMEIEMQKKRGSMHSTDTTCHAKRRKRPRARVTWDSKSQRNRSDYFKSKGLEFLGNGRRLVYFFLGLRGSETFPSIKISPLWGLNSKPCKREREICNQITMRWRCYKLYPGKYYPSMNCHISKFDTHRIIKTVQLE